MREFFDICTIIISTFFLVHSIKRILVSSRYLIYLLVFVLYIFPIYLDYFVGFQEHARYGFYVVMPDVATACVYDVGLIVTSLIILFFRVPKQSSFFTNLQVQKTNSEEGSYKLWLFVGMMLPAFFTVFLLRQPGMLYTFQWRELELFNIGGSYANVEKLTYFGISCAVMLLTDKNGKMLSLTRLAALLFIFVNICIQGKRGIMFFAIINIVVNLFLIYVSLGRDKKARKLFGMVSVVVIAFFAAYMVVMSVVVKVEQRGYNVDDSAALYTSTRIDFFRDDRMRMAIFAELHPEKMTILEHKGQTIIPTILSIIPLNYLADALDIPTPSYQQFLSCANAGIKFNHSPHADNPNFMTVTIFAELISNFGILLGVLLFSLLCVWFSKVIDRYTYPLNSFIICTFILLNLFNIPYLMLYAEIVLVLCIINKTRKNKHVKKNISHEGFDGRAITQGNWR